MKGNFQITLIVIFVGFALFGVLVFSGAIPLGNSKEKAGSGGTVVLWGTIKSDYMNDMVQKFNDTYKTYTIKYEQKGSETFDQDLLEALASGKGPDLFFLPDYLAYDYSNKIFTIPYESYPIANFKNTFAQASEVFLTSKGILAFPIMIDPLVMYYNRSILNDNGIVYPPANWSELSDMVKTITKTDNARQIIKSAVALGQYSNVLNAKDILVSLFMQAGSDIVKEGNGRFYSSLSDLDTAGDMLSFYTNFSNPLAEEYSWNKSLPLSRDSFSKESLAFYFGFASELMTLINKNPNQDFLSAPVPQLKNATFKTTSSRVTGVAVSAFSKNLNSALVVASLIASSDFAKSYSSVVGAPPARRDLLALKPTDAFYPTFYASALFAKSWLDPSFTETENVYRRMIDNVLSNSLSADSSVRDASSKISNLFLQ
jgi:ABC-type glycerol-3-phosphate transport system substrate-binding protein